MCFHCGINSHYTTLIDYIPTPALSQTLLFLLHHTIFPALTSLILIKVRLVVHDLFNRTNQSN